MQKDYNIPTPLRVSIFSLSVPVSLTHIRKNGRCTISRGTNCTTFYEFLKEPENDTKKLKQHNFLGKRRYYDWMQIIKTKKNTNKWPEEVAKLATVVTISVARVFFYSPWRPKRSQLGALKSVLDFRNCTAKHLSLTLGSTPVGL